MGVAFFGEPKSLVVLLVPQNRGTLKKDGLYGTETETETGLSSDPPAKSLFLLFFYFSGLNGKLPLNTKTIIYIHIYILNSTIIIVVTNIENNKAKKLRSRMAGNHQVPLRVPAAKLPQLSRPIRKSPGRDLGQHLRWLPPPLNIHSPHRETQKTG